MKEYGNSLEKIRAARYGRNNTSSAMEADNKPHGTSYNDDGSYSEYRKENGKWKESRYVSKDGKKITADDVAAKKNQSGFQNEDDIPANDAGNTKSDTNSEKNPAEQASLWKAFGEFLVSIISAITDLFKDFFQKQSVKIDYILRTDQGFLSDYNNAKKKYEPSTGQEVVIYPNIDPKKMTGPAQELEKYVKEVCREMQNVMIGKELPEDHILNVSAEEYKIKILKVLGCPNPDKYENIGDWIKYLRTNSLGEKKTVVIRPSDLPAYEAIAIKSVSALRGIVSADKNDVTAMTNELNRAFNAVSTKKDLPDEARNRCKKYANRAKVLLEDYKGIKEEGYNVFYMNIMQARNILQRMYKF